MLKIVRASSITHRMKQIEDQLFEECRRSLSDSLKELLGYGDPKLDNAGLDSLLWGLFDRDRLLPRKCFRSATELGLANDQTCRLIIKPTRKGRQLVFALRRDAPCALGRT